MIITRTPFRISFFGGGTDFPQWYNENGGVVLSTTVDKYCYVTCRYLPPFFNYKYRIRYTIREETQTISEIKHPSVRECLKFINLNNGIELQHNSDLPAMSGIGSSSAFTVGLLNGLYALKGEMISKKQLALSAINIEQNKIGESVGSQDQVAAAYGGFNKIEFSKNGISVSPVTVDKLDLLHSHLMLFFIGFPRYSSEIASKLIEQIPKKKSELREMMNLTEEAVGILNNGNITMFGKLLDESWKIKRSLLPQITNSFIDEIYKSGLSAGAIGGKLLGAGGGGFMLFFVPPEQKASVRSCFSKFLEVPFQFENSGSKVIFYEPS